MTAGKPMQQFSGSQTCLAPWAIIITFNMQLWLYRIVVKVVK